MHLTKPIAVVVILAVGGLWFYMTRDGVSRATSKADAEAPVTALEKQDLSPARSAIVTPPARPAAVVAAVDAGVARILVVAPERREGEQEEDYKLREPLARRFREWLYESKVSPEQEAKVLALMADAQVNYGKAMDLAWDPDVHGEDFKALHGAEDLEA